ncbi:type IV secretion system protein VirD4 [Pseudomonas peli]|uniref:Type IV secretion system protein VirD4 n=1 Tax=Pseudomonas peli TaxID=592361 RepID=A0A1G4U6H4_9PSED|nr:type IV secretory system conjugative DNA transfer family protein [Pseudomonas peli]NMZ71332.1 type IV secretory system conjugative DNA transfer family protein [Pseudomonas peli]NMZ71388.1 type IV secretory system conjugative DNA transfer family protein [Pseudomonas peli]SCW89224.1 type IV secretion system protein VirD4 [Pseudomonas peli]
MKPGKIIALVLVLLFTLIALLVAGQYAGGIFLLKRLGLDFHNVQLTTLYEYYQAYGKMGGPVEKFIKMGLAISFSPIGMILFLGIALLVTRKTLIDRLYGDARFATDIEIQNAGMFLDDKKDNKWPPVLLGRKGKRYIADYSQEYTTLAAPPGSGKGVGFVVPNLLTYPHSVINFDPKLENFNITSGYRSSVLGQEVFLFSPDNDKYQSHCWNCLDYISPDPRKTLADIKNISAILIPADPGPNQSFFIGARKALDGLLLYLVETPEEPRNMYRVIEINDSPIGIDKWIITTIARRAKSDRPLSDECVRMLMSYANETEKKRDTTKGIIGTYLDPFSDALCRAATQKSDFNFRDLRKKKMTIYVGIAPGNIPKFQRLLNLFFSQAITLNTDMLPEDGPKDENGDPVLKYQCLALLDEFVALGPIEIIRASSGYTRAYNMRYAIVFQNKAQVFADQCYGRAGGESLLDTFHNEIVYATESVQDSEEYSKRLGNTTLKDRARSRTRAKGGPSSTDSIQRHSRALMLPQEIQRLPYDKEVIFKKGGKLFPINADKIFWYKEELFAGKANMPVPEIPPMIFESKNAEAAPAIV